MAQGYLEEFTSKSSGLSESQSKLLSGTTPAVDHAVYGLVLQEGQQF